MSQESEAENVSSPPQTGRVSAIVITYFTGPVLARSIAALKAQPEVGEIILIDNGNFPGVIKNAIKAAPEGAHVQVHKSGENIGFAAACNRGASAAAHDTLLFLNPDAVMPSGGVAQMLADAQTLERPWLMGAKLVNPDGSEQQGSRRATLTPWRAFVEGAKLYKLAPRHPYFVRFNLHAQACPEEVVEVPTISGACFMLPRDDYFAIEGMDEGYFLHVEDVDFCLRFINAGGKVYFNPHVSVEHFKSSSRANPIKIEARKTRGIIRYFDTHFSKAYPKPFLWLVAGLLWFSFGLLFVKRAIGKALRLAGLRAKMGQRGVDRAKAISARRSSR